MPIDANALLALWSTDEMPACDEGMMLAQAFLESCGQGVTRIGAEEPADRLTDITVTYNMLIEHVSNCEKCGEI
jgi:hypothetical protein